LGNTALVIEHNLDVIKCADWVIDLGPEAGSEGGQVVFVGTPEDLVDHAVKPAKKRRGVADGRLRSYTGEALAELIQQGQYHQRKNYDPSSVHQKQEGDLELEQIGRDTLLPWQADGRRWHCADSTDRSGQPIRWDRQILKVLIDRMEQMDGFAPVQWENRSIVEVSGPIKSRGWFLHAITADTWLVTLKFRVPRRSFTKAELESVVRLTTLNELEGVEAYGNEPRVRAKAAGAWMELQLRPNQLSEIDQPKFWQWLEKAAHAFLGKTTDSDEIENRTDGSNAKAPWQILKQRWHALRKGFPAGRDIVWPAETLSVFIQAVHQAVGGGRWRWDDATQARYFLDGQTEPWIVLHTKRPEGLICVLNGPRGFESSSLRDNLSVPLQVTQRSDDQEQLQVAFTQSHQPREAGFRKLLSLHAKHSTDGKLSTTNR
jgi:excinuclease ABC subunit A